MSGDRLYFQCFFVFIAGMREEAGAMANFADGVAEVVFHFVMSCPSAEIEGLHDGVAVKYASCIILIKAT